MAKISKNAENGIAINDKKALHCTLKKAEGVDSVMKTDKKTGRKL